MRTVIKKYALNRSLGDWKILLARHYGNVKYGLYLSVFRSCKRLVLGSVRNS